MVKKRIKYVYLAGPISNNLDSYVEDFNELEEKVKLVYPKSEVINPARVSESFVGFCLDFPDVILDITRKLLCECDLVVVMSNDIFSAGLAAELDFAKELGIDVVFENDLNMRR